MGEHGEPAPQRSMILDLRALSMDESAPPCPFPSSTEVLQCSRAGSGQKHGALLLSLTPAWDNSSCYHRLLGLLPELGSPRLKLIEWRKGVEMKPS